MILNADFIDFKKIVLKLLVLFRYRFLLRNVQ